ncbi:MAG: primosomal protein N' [Candidatus Onthovivens sp.]|nr:primosomal protein N' [Candidatus Onthovivens sp.]
MFLLKVLVEHTNYALNNFFYYASNTKVDKGCRVFVTFHNQSLISFVCESTLYECNIEELSDTLGINLSFIDGVIDDRPIIDDELYNLAFLMSKRYFYPLIGVLKTMLPPSLKPGGKIENKPSIKYDYYLEYTPNPNIEINRFEEKTLQKFIKNPKIEKSKVSKTKSLLSLIQKGLIKEVSYERYSYKPEKIYNYHSRFELTPEQNAVFNELVQSEDLVYLLFGVTGSGKTEIYIKYIEKCLCEGKNALILVPEIALTPLMISRILSYFDEPIAVLHSSLSSQQKYDEYRKISEGKAKIVIGTRSAIFAPLKNIGVIIIDEEDSTLYKEEENCSYNARDIAILRAKNCNGKVILGSATPSIESMMKAKKGIYHLLKIENRYGSSDLPNIKVVDRGNYLNFSSKSSIFSLQLISEIKNRLDRNEKVILFINNKGYSRSLICRDCGEVIKCPTCGLPLAYYAEDNTLRCSQCDYKIKKPTSCPNCGSKYFSYLGFGIEKVEEDFKKIFNVPYLILDGERTSKTLQISTILSKFYNGEANVLIGTQMVSKGHDFDNVTLVAIINADSLISYPSYKSSENAYSLLVQTIGRAGRKDKKGTALIQTTNQDNFIIQTAIDNDYETFYLKEVEQRSLFKNPPFFNILSIRIFSKKLKNLDVYSDEIYNFLKLSHPTFYINKFSSSKKFGNQFTKSVYLKYKTFDEIEKTINNLINTFKNKNDLRIKINVNPYDY